MDVKRAKRDASGKPSGSWTVSPTELREALSGLGKAAVRFELSEMHDASEVSLFLVLCKNQLDPGRSCLLPSR